MVVESIPNVAARTVRREMELGDQENDLGVGDVDLELHGEVLHSFCEVGRESASNVIGENEAVPAFARHHDRVEQNVAHVDVAAARLVGARYGK